MSNNRAMNTWKSTEDLHLRKMAWKKAINTLVSTIIDSSLIPIWKCNLKLVIKFL